MNLKQLHSLQVRNEKGCRWVRDYHLPPVGIVIICMPFKCTMFQPPVLCLNPSSQHVKVNIPCSVHKLVQRPTYIFAVIESRYGSALCGDTIDESFLRDKTKIGRIEGLFLSSYFFLIIQLL
jgi:hypothetical protein